MHIKLLSDTLKLRISSSFRLGHRSATPNLYARRWLHRDNIPTTLEVAIAIVALAAQYACNSRAPTPDVARAELDRRGIEYNGKTFVASAKAGQLDVIKLFLEAGIDPDVRSDSDVTASMEAAAAGSAGVLRVLLERGANVSLVDDQGRTALHRAATANGSVCVSLLLKYQADPNAKTHRGNTALMEAIFIPPADSFVESFAFSKLVESVTVLIDHGADVNVRNQDGVTPLMRAALMGNTQVVRALLNHGADVQAGDNLGRTPRMYALDYKHDDAARLIQQAGG